MFAHTDRPLTLTTPLGPDALMLTAVRGREALSELFHFDLEALWQDSRRTLPFDDLLGQKVTVTISHRSGKRHINGIVARIVQAERDLKSIKYRLEVVPQLWLLTRIRQSRIFQHLSVPEILRKVFTGLDVTYGIQGTFQPREYCTQYRETDFQFASRLMEEEGICYFFQHTSGGHKLVLNNTPQGHPEVPYQSEVRYEELSGHTAEEDRVYDWRKSQEIRSGKYTLWDHSFELPGKHLEAQKSIMGPVQVGTVQHKLNVANDHLEQYEYPGGYARHFDAVNKTGGDQSGNLQHVFEDNTRTVGIRMQEEAAGALLVDARGGHAGFTAGHSFNLTEHFSDNGKFVIVSVEHDAQQAIGDESVDAPYEYKNQFTCIPSELPYRPRRATPVPSVQGVQTGIVVGPAGEEIFTDEYGRVKVQFHWDREGVDDINSSCWMRVGTPWAGKCWGTIYIPRIGQEVIVDFVEGCVDHPIVLGSVYNAAMMPPYKLPDNKTQSGIKTRSSKSGGPDNYNEIRFEDKKGSEQVLIHAEMNQDIEVENDETHWVGRDRKKTIDRDETVHVKRDRMETVDRDETVTIHGKQTNTIDGDQSTTVTTGNQMIEIQVGNQTTKIDVGKIETSALQSIELTVGPSSIKLDPAGITIKGLTISVEASVQGTFKSLLTQVEGTAMTKVQGGLVMIN
jgi:type VI secretion system secreted protein VgrG